MSNENGDKRSIERHGSFVPPSPGWRLSINRSIVGEVTAFLAEVAADYEAALQEADKMRQEATRP